MWGWDTGWGLGIPALSRYQEANALTTDLQAGKQDNSHPGWFSSQVILSQCGHSNINTLSKVPALLPYGGGCWGDSRHWPLLQQGSCTGLDTG